MVVRTTTGSIVSIEKTDGRYLYDSNGVSWERYPIADDADHASYRDTKSRVSILKLTKEELRRICAGPAAISTPTTVLEMRFFAKNLSQKEAWLVDSWNDEKLESVLEDAVKKGADAGGLLKFRVWAELHKEQEAKKKPEKAQETAPPVKAAKNTPKRRKREGGTVVTTGGVSVTLTPKQLEFMERLSENQGWSEDGPNGSYAASLYAEELSDTMNPMSVGAVLTTLREKGLLATKKVSYGGIKTCMFTLTETGKKVYAALASKEGK